MEGYGDSCALLLVDLNPSAICAPVDTSRHIDVIWRRTGGGGAHESLGHESSRFAKPLTGSFPQ
ncbi:hypothetical protein OUZ56_006956 [Daphnia magna]|uniref:Uncharacterized protein n=1 Tax=Daphnia magna TaxID=35525 RepID=A0ABQ9YX68_9CRUS|nr:hypothetical protein OUZ56_006956 [Daphnia magna]